MGSCSVRDGAGSGLLRLPDWSRASLSAGGRPWSLDCCLCLVGLLLFWVLERWAGTPQVPQPCSPGSAAEESISGLQDGRRRETR